MKIKFLIARDNLVYFTNGKEGQTGFPAEGANLCFNHRMKRYWKFERLPFRKDPTWIEIDKSEFLKIVKYKGFFKLV